MALLWNGFVSLVLEEIRLAADACEDGYHECYLKVYALIRSRDKSMARAFNYPRRSQAFILLANIIEEGLLTDAELNQFSAEARERIEIIDRMRRA